MAHDESQHQGDEHSQTGGPPDEALAPITIGTTDPVIDTAVEHVSDWKHHPDATLRVETTQVSESDLPCVTGVRTIVAESHQKRDHQRRDEDDPERQDDGDQAKKHGNSPDRPQGQNGRNQDRGGQQPRQHDEDRGRQDQPRQPQPSMMKNILITAGVALVCGVIGAMGYVHFFGPKSKGPSSDESQGKSDSASKKDASSQEKSGGGASKESNWPQASSPNPIPGVTSAKDADMLEQQIKDLSQRVDQLRERVDGLTRPTDATPPVLRTMQIKMSELAREMAEVTVLPAAYRHYDNQLETLREELKTLRGRIEAAPADSIGGRIPSPTPLAGIAAPASSTGGSKASNLPPVLSTTPTARKDPSGGP